MALGDFQYLDISTIQSNGAKKYNVAAGATAILAGEPVAHVLGAAVVTQMATNKPVVGTDFMAGIATSNSTQTATVAGTVDVLPLQPGVQYLVSAKVPATWATQALYNALVGSRVLIDLTTGTFTALAADAATNGAVVVNLDVSRYPGKVAVAFRNAVSDLA